MSAPGRVGLVLVAHVADLATGLRDLVAQMAPDVTILPAGGTDDGGVGTSFDLVVGAIERADSGAGAVVLYDLGSALLTTQTALELVDDEARARVRIADAPLVEGAVAAGVEAQGNGDLAAVLAAARSADPSADRSAGRPATVPAGGAEADPVRGTGTLVNKVGLHARPAGVLARALADLDAEVRVGRPGDEGVNARSVLSVIGLGLGPGQEVEYAATGPDAERAVEAALVLTADRFGDEE